MTIQNGHISSLLFLVAVPMCSSVYNGCIVSPGKYPFMGAILGSGPDCNGARCLVDGATVITSQHLLTSCYAVRKMAAFTNPYVYLGHEDLRTKDPSYAFGIKKYTCYDQTMQSAPQSNSEASCTYNYFATDLAVIELDRRIDFEGEHGLVRPVYVPLSIDVASEQAKHQHSGGCCIDQQNCVLLGWGQFYNGMEQSNSLRECPMPVLGNEPCVNDYYYAYDSTRMICAGQTSPPYYGICYGDAGGPLVCALQHTNTNHTRYCLTGVATFTRNHCYAYQDQGWPSVFLRVHYFADWIQSVIENH